MGEPTESTESTEHRPVRVEALSRPVELWRGWAGWYYRSRDGRALGPFESLEQCLPWVMGEGR